jgi:biopolymer transport protein ExbD
MKRQPGFHIEADETGPVGDINMTPLIDVMLVLLIMLIITVPLQTQSVTTAFAAGAPPADPPPTVAVDIGTEGRISWDHQPLAAPGELDDRLRTLAATVPQPGLLLHAARDVPYRDVVTVLAKVQRAGATNVGLKDAP